MSSNSIRDTFFEECEELLEALTEGLAQMQAGTHNPETVNAVFRAAHSVKGGAGAFGLDALVAFAHRFETVLDALRAGRIELAPELMHILLRSADHLADQVEAAHEEREIDPEVTAGFLANLATCLDEEELATAEPGLDDDPCFGFSALPLDFGPIDLPAAEIGTHEFGYEIYFKPLQELLENGHEPSLLLIALADLGPMSSSPELAAMPDWAGIDPQPLWLAWKIRLETSETEATVRAVFEFVEGLCDLNITPLHQEAPPLLKEPALPVIAILPIAPAELPAAPLAPASAPPAGKPPRSETRPPDEDGDGRGPKPTLRVDLDRVDRLINAVGELIINQAMIEQSILDLSLPTDAEVITHTEDYRLLARDIQEAVMAIRAQPVKPLFQRMSRIIREAAAATGKSARMITSGESTEVDKTVIERLADPLTHMIRNAVDHGLEPTEIRLAAGKPAEGTIRLSAAHRSGSVIITVRDDGGGLNRQRVLQKAIDKELIPAGTELSDAEIDNLLFLPGFSTAEKISNLSGRGVGLDVVKNAVTALGGRIAIASNPGLGTEFTISLPLTLAVMDGMVISVSGQTMVIPIASVIETIRPAPSDLHQIGTGDLLLAIRGRFLPMIDVAQCLGFPDRDASQPPLLLLVETENQNQCALIVDAVHDQRQVVIKGLESNYGTVPGVSAATVLGDGQIALILDSEALTANRPLATTTSRSLPGTGALYAAQ